MISLNLENVTSQAVGAEHGLALPELYQDYQAPIAEAIDALYAGKNDVGGWKKWLNLGYQTQLAQEITAYAQSVHGQFDDLLVIGIGGSSLGGRAMLEALLHPRWNYLTAEQRQHYPRFHFLENIDSDEVHGLLHDVLNPAKTLVCIISKSGTTPEPSANFAVVKAWLVKALGHNALQKHIVAITDKNSGALRAEADANGYRTFEVPDDVGGRFSVFSAVGMLPAALCGLPLDDIQAGIRDMDTVLQNPNVQDNPAAQLALIHFALNNKGHVISVFMPYSQRLKSVADWYVQLWGESLGKQINLSGQTVNAGQTPLGAVGPIDQHSLVQLLNEGPFHHVMTFVEVQSPDHPMTIATDQLPSALGYLGNRRLDELMQASLQGTRDNLASNHRPNLTITLPKLAPYSFAQLLYLLEVQTAIAGALWAIDPFDQPGVEGGKKRAKAYLEQTAPRAISA